MKIIKKFEYMTNNVVHVPAEIYSDIAWEIEKKSEWEEDYKGNITYKFNEYEIYMEFNVNRDYREESGGSDQYGNREKILMQNKANVNINFIIVFDKDGDECLSNLDKNKIESTFKNEFGGRE